MRSIQRVCILIASYPCTWYCQFCFFLSYWNMFVVKFHHGFNLHFHNGYDVEQNPMHLFFICVSVLVKHFFRSFVHIFIVFFCFTEFWELITNSGYKHFIRFMIWKAFCYSVVCLFIFLKDFSAISEKCLPK